MNRQKEIDGVNQNVAPLVVENNHNQEDKYHCTMIHDQRLITGSHHTSSLTSEPSKSARATESSLSPTTVMFTNKVSYFDTTGTKNMHNEATSTTISTMNEVVTVTEKDFDKKDIIEADSMTTLFISLMTTKETITSSNNVTVSMLGNDSEHGRNTSRCSTGAEITTDACIDKEEEHGKDVDIKKSSFDDQTKTTVMMNQQQKQQKSHLTLSQERMDELSIRVKEVACRKFQNHKTTMGEFAIKRLALFPRLDRCEIQLGKHLGSGQFGIVTEIRHIALSKKKNTPFHSEEERIVKLAVNEETEYNENDNDDGMEQDRIFLEAHCQRENVEDGCTSARYAIKKLQDHRCSSDEETYVCGVLDLAVEAHILAGLEHPHIVKLRGLSRDADMGSRDFFLIMDRLVCTLRDKLIQWRQEQRHLQGCYRRKNGSSKAIAVEQIIHHCKLNYNKTRKSQTSSSKKALLFLEERLCAMKDLSSAILYLHNQGIMDRDIKPDNIGFDIRGDIKLFDFGLSTIFDPQASKPYYNLTSNAGTLNYMAPEVYYVDRPYDESADIYSLGLVFWQMLALAPLFPFKMSTQLFCELVYDKKARPEIKNMKLTQSLKNLLCDMWNHDPKIRPTAKQVNLILQRELANVKSNCITLNETKSSSTKKKLLKAITRKAVRWSIINTKKNPKNLSQIKMHCGVTDNDSHNSQTNHAFDGVGTITCGDNIGNTLLTCFTEEEYDVSQFVPRRKSTYVQRRFVNPDEE